MRDWTFWEWAAYGSIAISILGDAIEQWRKRHLHVVSMNKFARFFDSGFWATLPLAFLILGTAIFLAREVGLIDASPRIAESTAQSKQAPWDSVAAQPKAPVAAASGSLRRHYSASDRERLSELLFILYKYLNENVSPPQLEIHSFSTTTARLGELRDKLEMARRYLGDFTQANAYYQEEIVDVLGVRDLLNADIGAINNYIDVVSAVSPDPQDRAARVISPSREGLREANVNLGTWVSECLNRINAKRDALQ